jgi:hypothetical protein
MFNIFTQTNNTISYSIKSYPKFNFIKRRYVTELDKIINYYRNKIRVVDNTHILSRIINTLVPSLELEDLHYLNIIKSNSRLTSKQFNIVSNINNGEVLKNIFYTGESNEILLYTEHNYELNYIKNNYKNIDSVKVIYTDETDINFYTFFNNEHKNDMEYTVYEIDIITMLLQYKYWAMEQYALGYSIDINVFIPTIILPNMMKNMLDLNIFNRYLELFKYDKVKEFNFNHPFSVIDYSTGIDVILKDIVKLTHNSNMDLYAIFLHIPTIYNNNMLETLKINNYLFTKQSLWVLYISRLKYVSNMLDILDTKGIKRNRAELNKLPRILKELKNRSTELDNKLNENIMFNIEYYIDNIQKHIGYL